MRKVVYEKYGDAGVLSLREVPEPSISDDQVLVGVKAVAINPLDWKLFEGQLKFLTGWKFPRGVGIEFAGEVLEVGKDVRSFKPGAPVFGMLEPFTGGALAEQLAVPASGLHHRPTTLSWEKAAALPIGALSAMQIVDDLAQIQPDTRVLVNGATGGVGAFVTQISLRRGARVTATVSARGIALAERWGSQEVVDYGQTPIAGLGERFDVIVDLSGKLPYSAAKPLMAPKSVYVNCNPNPVDMLVGAVQNTYSGRQRRILQMKDRPEQLAQVCRWVEEGMEVVVGRTYAFTQFREAYEEVKAKGALGKAVFLMDGATGEGAGGR